jgi:hypothetical protein
LNSQWSIVDSQGTWCDGTRRTSHAKAGFDVWRKSANIQTMKALILFVGWCILFALCWRLAVAALVLLPVVWLLSLPLRLVGITFGAVFALIRTILFLPARLLGWRKVACHA